MTSIVAIEKLTNAEKIFLDHFAGLSILSWENGKRQNQNIFQSAFEPNNWFNAIDNTMANDPLGEENMKLDMIKEDMPF